jgi:cyclic lactone autoinducer peptide
MKKFIASLIVFLLLAFGLASAAGACFFLVYQPEMPQKPQK